MTSLERQRYDVQVIVNGVARHATVEARTLLVDLLREGLGLTGTHIGCEQGACGACTVLVDGKPTLACLMLAVQAAGTVVETVEGLATASEFLNGLQLAFRRHHAVQCGYCTPGMVMTATALLRRGVMTSERDVRAALIGNLCRCTGYQPVVDAILEVIRIQHGLADHNPETSRSSR